MQQVMRYSMRRRGDEAATAIKRRFDFAGVHSLGLMHLTATVMRAFGTMNAYRVLLKGNRERVVVVGFESDVEQFAVLANSLHLQAIVAMRAWWKAMPFWEKDGLTQHEGNMAKRQFLVSFGQGAATRIKKATEEIVAQEGTGTNGANFFTPPDGTAPRLQLFLWTFASPPRDAALDHTIVVHELAHGLTNRLTGGPATTSCLGNAEQGGEGWSDWYALMFTQRPGHTRAFPRGMGTYAMGGMPTDPEEATFRPAPYTTDFARNGYTYGDTRTLPAPHGTGFVWATVLWELTWDLIDAHGFSPDLHDAEGGAGNQRALRLVTEALKLQPCGPGLVDARDAILAADQVLYGGAHHETLWHAFARRGLGLSANQGSANSNADNVAAFDVPIFTTAVSEAPGPAPTLHAVAPNPVRDAAEVAFTLGAAGPVRIVVVDARGREVAVLADAARPAGAHRLRLDAGAFAPGVYVVRLTAGGQSQARMFTVVR